MRGFDSCPVQKKSSAGAEGNLSPLELCYGGRGLYRIARSPLRSNGYGVPSVPLMSLPFCPSQDCVLRWLYCFHHRATLMGAISFPPPCFPRSHGESLHCGDPLCPAPCFPRSHSGDSARLPMLSLPSAIHGKDCAHQA